MSTSDLQSYRDSLVRPLSWQERLAEACTEEEVVQTVRDYLAAFSYVDIAQLPMTCRPARLMDGNDVATYGLELARHQGDEPREVSSLILKLATFFVGASMRISELHRRTNDDDIGNARERA